MFATPGKSSAHGPDRGSYCISAPSRQKCTARRQVALPHACIPNTPVREEAAAQHESRGFPREAGPFPPVGGGRRDLLRGQASKQAREPRPAPSRTEVVRLDGEVIPEPPLD